MDNDKEVFPFEPHEVRRSRSYVFEYGDFNSEKEVEQLILLLWSEPESPVYYYRPKDVPTDSALSRAERDGVIRATEMKRRYYKHPKSGRDYIHIPEREGKYAWDWEKDVVEKGPECWQIRLELAARKKEELDAWRKVQLEEAYREQLRQGKYLYDVFLSYAEVDTKEAEMLNGKLVSSNAKVFMAPKVIRPGDDFAEEIRSALEGAKELWLLVSPTSAKSEWVISEWGAAWVLRKRIVPILHRCTPESLPDRLRKLHCIDFYRCDELIKNTFGNAERPGQQEDSSPNPSS